MSAPVVVLRTPSWREIGEDHVLVDADGVIYGICQHNEHGAKSRWHALARHNGQLCYLDTFSQNELGNAQVTIERALMVARADGALDEAMSLLERVLGVTCSTIHQIGPDNEAVLVPNPLYVAIKEFLDRFTEPGARPTLPEPDSP